MSRRTRAVLADIIEDRVDRSRQDSTFDQFVQDTLDLTFQQMASIVPWSRWLLDEVSLTATVSGTQYIVIPADMDIDSIISLTDRANSNRRITRISPLEADNIDPGRDMTGDEIVWWYQRVETTSPAFEDRIYFLHRPDSADTISAIFGTVPPIPVAGSNTYILPEKYEWILIEGALEKVWDHLDPDNPNRKAIHAENFKSGILIIKRDANTPTEESGLYGHRPRTSAGIKGASFPADYDVL